MVVFWLALTILVFLALWTLWWVRRDYREGEQLTPGSVASVWVLYLLHFALEVYAAWVGYWSYSQAPTLSILLGMALAIAGFTLLALGLLHLRSIRRISGVDTSQLITKGIYRWSRNPQNVGWALILVGIALIGRSLLALLLAFFFWGLFLLYVPMEERYLEKLYGEEYRQYKRKTHRYFGFPRDDVVD